MTIDNILDQFTGDKKLLKILIFTIRDAMRHAEKQQPTYVANNPEHHITEEIDKVLNVKICNALSGCDVFLLTEESGAAPDINWEVSALERILSGASPTFIIDELDNTKGKDGYVQGGNTWCSTACWINGSSGEPVASMLMMPDMEFVYIDGAGSYRTRAGVTERIQATDGPTPNMVAFRQPRPRPNKPSSMTPAQSCAFDRAALELGEYESRAGSDLTAKDILSVAQGSLTSFVYAAGYLWDVLPALAVAEGAGAIATDLETGEPIFPLSETLLRRGLRKERTGIRVDRP